MRVGFPLRRRVGDGPATRVDHDESVGSSRVHFVRQPAHLLEVQSLDHDADGPATPPNRRRDRNRRTSGGSADHDVERLVRRGGEYYLDDCGSLNGTYVNRRRIESHRLTDGDELQIGKYKLAFLSR